MKVNATELITTKIVSCSPSCLFYLVLEYTHSCWPGQGMRRPSGGQEQEVGGPASPGQNPATSCASTYVRNNTIFLFLKIMKQLIIYCGDLYLLLNSSL
jgi:hypothetical protein